MSEYHQFDVIVVGGGHAGRTGGVREYGSRPVSGRTMDGADRVSLRGHEGRADETSVSADQASVLL